MCGLKELIGYYFYNT